MSTSEPRHLRRLGLSAAFAGMAALGAGLGYVAQRPLPDESVFINFDPESTLPQDLVEGWSRFEWAPAGDTYVWCTQRTCVLRVFVREKVSRRLRARVFAHAYPGAPVQRMTVSLNGHSLGVRDVSEQPGVLSYHAESAHFREGSNLLKFDFTYAVSSEQHSGTDEDSRLLAAAFDWIELVRR